MFARLAGADVDPNEGRFRPFYTLHETLAFAETRALHFSKGSVVPPGRYDLIEAFCAGKSCDCRRAMLFVRAGSEHVTTIGFGWEPLDFYVKWARGDHELARDAKGPILEPDRPRRCSYESALLEVIQDQCLASEEYVDRVRRHYLLFKESLPSRSPGSTPSRGTSKNR
ncbi:MAG: hypothetical protein HY791_35425 [Deltaproteobacteria bacterium]|nr:hypothetical protein [Deltaproteobacteria bacterium]